MNISLRKANVLQNSINDAIRGIDITTQVDLNEFQDVAVELKKANDSLFDNDARRQKLLLALYNIRGLVGTANAQSGIDLNLAKNAFIDKRIKQLEDIGSCRPMTELAVLNGRLEKQRARKDESVSLYSRESVSTTVVTEEQITQIKTEIKRLKKDKHKLNDEILELNIKTEIPLSEHVVNTLTAEGLI